MKTNTLLIQVDQMNARCLSALGHSYVKTPNLDRLAEQGFLFDHAVCNNPICMPSRASMLSGQYPATLCQFGFGGLCDRRTPWLQGQFKQAGYQTGAFGKFHVDCIGEDQWDFDLTAPDLPEDHDLARPRDWTYENYCREHDVPWMTDQIHGHLPFEHKRSGVRGKNGVHPKSSDESMHPYRRQACLSDVPLEHSIEIWETDQCLKGLQQFQQAEDQPWFAWLSYQRPHCPTPLPEPWFSRIRPEDIDLEPLPSAEDLATWARSTFATFRHGPSRLTLGDDDFRFIVASYCTLIEFLDQEIGRVLDWLEETGLDQTTTVVFTSDHGDDAGQRNCYDKYGIFLETEGVTNVPLIIRPAPCLNPSPPRRVHEPVELVDLAPTLLNLSGLSIPEAMEGRDLSPNLLEGAPLDPDRAVFCEEYYRRMIKHRDWRLVLHAEDPNECTLYDLNTDPLAHRNLYSSTDPGVAAHRLDLKRRLFAHVMQQHHGPWTEADVDRIRKGLDPKDPTLPVRLSTAEPNCYPFRAAASICMEGQLLLVPYFEEDFYLFDASEGAYQTSETRLPSDPERIEAMLNWALSKAILQVMPVSINHPLRPAIPSEPVTLQEAREALNRPLPGG